MQIQIVRRIEAPVDVVFDTVADVRELKKALPHIWRVEFLSEQEVGLGTRFRETRDMNGRRMTNELEVTEFEVGRKIRYLTENGGSLWGTVFLTEPIGNSTQLTLCMDVSGKNFLIRMVTSLFKSMIAKVVRRDVDLIQAYCQNQT